MSVGSRAGESNGKIGTTVVEQQSNFLKRAFSNKKKKAKREMSY